MANDKWRTHRSATGTLYVLHTHNGAWAASVRNVSGKWQGKVEVFKSGRKVLAQSLPEAKAELERLVFEAIKQQRDRNAAREAGSGPQSSLEVAALALINGAAGTHFKSITFE